jgi:hypothetical protein
VINIQGFGYVLAGLLAWRLLGRRQALTITQAEVSVPKL